MNYGLIGEKLGHSFSKIIHEQLAAYQYELKPLSPEELPGFMRQLPFKAINVTIPYKEMVIPYCHTLDEAARAIGAVNTLVNDNGVLSGYNTDLSGFLYMLEYHGFHLKDKKVMILGSGGTAKTVAAAVHAQAAARITVVSRAPGAGRISYQRAVNCHDVQALINTTPVGMYPLNGQTPIGLQQFAGLELVIDVIYNPLKSGLLLEAERLGLPYCNGLLMLVAQAKYAAEHFTKTAIPDEKIGQIYRQLNARLHNLVLIGMPSAGKTTLGAKLAQHLGRPFYDADQIIVQKTGLSIAAIFAQQGESAFREIERRVLAEFAKENGVVIATGGGAVKDAGNMLNLKQNGIIIHVARAPEYLLVDGAARPLSPSRQALLTMATERGPLYEKYCDMRIDNNLTIESALENILEIYNEIAGN